MVSSVNWHLTRHGESLSQILKVASFVVVLCAVLFSLGGFASSERNQIHKYSINMKSQSRTLSEFIDSILLTSDTLLQSWYFSVITFTTIGYGDLYPLGTISQILVCVESLAGSILVALFIFVLGRRVAR
ncbi:potassium channel family protein [Haloarchaeobius amylolyticus]|uniref:potassium channel family protein n=1 Tax=Haloarchaeobius amylolyticus TaxID=1198296 RepID=UPI0034A17816